MISYSLFVVDDEEYIRDAALLNLTEYQVKAFADAEQAIAALDNEAPDLILMDIGLPGMDGVEALEAIKADRPDMLFIMITAYEDVDTVVAAMKAGAYDYVVKPLHMDTLKVTIENALETIRLRKEVLQLQERLLKDNLPCFIAESNDIQDVMDFVAKVARSPDAPVMIVGQTGTGKELVAGAIHYQSPLFRGPFVRVNCAALPGELVESELFGYEPGAFSGALPGGKRGLIEEAKGGTLFLDELGDMGLGAQAKLLRFLDSGEYYKVGGTQPQKAKVRVVSATNQDLESLIEQGKFRRDLYFRLGVVRVEIPSLSSRRDDILPIARHFLLEFNDKYGRQFKGLSKKAGQFLRTRSWPGNVRELKGLVERGVLTGTEPEITPANLGAMDQPAAPSQESGGLPRLTEAGLDLGRVVEEVERDYFSRAMELADGSDSKAAELLGLNYHTFRYRRKKLMGD